MTLAPLGAEILSPYWAEFSSVSEYKVLLPADIKQVAITTRHGNKPVGAIINRTGSSGTLILLPDVEFDRDDFQEKRDGELAWSAEAERFAARMIASVVSLDRAIHAANDVTPQPDWATDSRYALPHEQALRSALIHAEGQVEEAQRRKEYLSDQLNNAGRLRALLYEKGKLLENAIIEALQLLGFKAAPYKEGGSEFDVVFECAEGRLLGEAEGKDTKAINVDKLRQLGMNIQEDLQREEVTTPAKGVLFGNGYRLSPPEARDVQFTEKCITASKASLTALITTSSLFAAVQYLVLQEDPDYAKLCREAILMGVGPVTLPTPPERAHNVLVDISNELSTEHS